MRNWIIGLEHTYILYKKHASAHDMQRWARQVMWPVIIYQIFRKTRFIDNAQDEKFARDTLMKFHAVGMFDNPPGGVERYYKRKIMRFIRASS